MNDKANSSRFRRGESRPANAGRQPGSPNLRTTILNDAIQLAVELEGDEDLFDFDLSNSDDLSYFRQNYKKLTDEAAKRGGLVGYLRWVARRHPAAMCGLLGRMLPLQAKMTAHKEVVYKSVDEIQAEIIARRLPLGRIAPLILDMEKHSRLNEDDDDTDGKE
jgi:hypothetical protein